MHYTLYQYRRNTRKSYFIPSNTALVRMRSRVRVSSSAPKIPLGSGYPVFIIGWPFFISFGRSFVFTYTPTLSFYLRQQRETVCRFQQKANQFFAKSYFKHLSYSTVYGACGKYFSVAIFIRIINSANFCRIRPSSDLFIQMNH